MSDVELTKEEATEAHGTLLSYVNKIPNYYDGWRDALAFERKRQAEKRCVWAWFPNGRDSGWRGECGNVYTPDTGKWLIQDGAYCPGCGSRIETKES